MKIFEYDAYKAFVQDRIEQMPGKGRGQYRALAEKLRMHTTLVSQVFRGDRHLTPEQACDLCTYWGLTALETEMFLALLNRERAGSKTLQKTYTQQIDGLRKRSEKFSQRLPQEKILTKEVQLLFYSSWYYSAIRLLTSIPKYRSVDNMAERLSLPRQLVSEVVEFLVANGLCIRNKKDEIVMGPQRTHLAKDSPLIAKHHLNWRLKGLNRLEGAKDHEILFTAPLSISEKDADKVRKKIYALVEEISEIVKDTDAEKVCYLNIDWLDL